MLIDNPKQSSNFSEPSLHSLVWYRSVPRVPGPVLDSGIEWRNTGTRSLASWRSHSSGTQKITRRLKWAVLCDFIHLVGGGWSLGKLPWASKWHMPWALKKGQLGKYCGNPGERWWSEWGKVWAWRDWRESEMYVEVADGALGREWRGWGEQQTWHLVSADCVPGTSVFCKVISSSQDRHHSSHFTDRRTKARVVHVCGGQARIQSKAA